MFHLRSFLIAQKENSEDKRLCTPSVAGKQTQNVPETAEWRAQSSSAQVNSRKGGEMRRRGSQVGAGNKPQWDIPIHI